ncbi:hypothetical protein S40293_11440 [Stachybotrys chartarum IBT 40293]|nr:hypothetical protein S40293_11440 [Stachybotrys chartarum IBT 40293]
MELGGRSELADAEGSFIFLVLIGHAAIEVHQWEGGKEIVIRVSAAISLTRFGGEEESVFCGLGSTASTLVSGWDCPASATYLDTVVHENSFSTPHNNSICIFEQDPGYAISRHTASNYVTVTKRMYSLCLDGTAEVKVRASWYIQCAYHANNEEYRYHIHDALSGYMLVEGAPKHLEIQRSWVNNEDEVKLNWASNSASSYVIVNKDAVNPYGEYRGYKIAPNLGAPVYLTVQNSTNAPLAVNFATHNLYATRQKDMEPKSVATWNNQDLSDPLVDFNEFSTESPLIKKISTIKTTLTHPGSDLPNTVFTSAQAGIAIIPHNYLISDPSCQISHSVYIDLTSGAAEESVYGGEQATCAYDLSQQYPNLSEFTICEPLRKWPEGYAGGGA